jgi:hypothetical protein
MHMISKCHLKESGYLTAYEGRSKVNIWFKWIWIQIGRYGSYLQNNADLTEFGSITLIIADRN